MANEKTPSPMHAKSAGASASRITHGPQAAKEPALPADASPESVLDLLRELVSEDQVGGARRLLDEAARRFPDHSRIQLARSVLAEGEATPNPFAQPTATEEIEWLRQPPQEARGKWIALIGAQLVGMADSAEELMALLRSESFEQLPVVQFVAP